MATKTIKRFIVRAVQLYEQEQGEPKGSPAPLDRLEGDMGLGP